MKRKKKGTWLMTGGLLLIAAALFLTCFNLWDERRATNSAGEALRELKAVRPEEAEATEPGEAEIPAVAGEEGATRHYCGRRDGGDDGKAWHCNTRGGQHVSVRKTTVSLL